MEKLPHMVGPFIIEALLDRGGMSTLYLALHPQTKETIVIKVLSEKLLDRKEVLDRFLHECVLLRELNHPGIVKAIDAGPWEGGYYLALEYVQGVSLRKWIGQAPISLPRALQITIDIAKAVCHLHIHGIIHRDLKPENLLLGEDGRVKLIDLGIARRIDEETEWAEAGRYIGTPSYMSPEQLVDPAKVSFPSDIFSIGVIAYELVLGRHSHGHIHLSLMPKGLGKILAKALQPRPEERYQDVVDFITDLVDYQTKVLESPSKEGLSPLALALEGLDKGLQDLSPKEPPKLNHIEVVWSNQRGVISVPFVFGITPKKGGALFFFGESGSFGPRGALEAAFLRGIELGLTGGLQERGEQLKRLVEKDPSAPLYKSAYLDIQGNQFAFLSFGTPKLIRISSNGSREAFGGNAPALGVITQNKLPIVQGQWSIGDLLLFDPSGLLDTLIEQFPPYEGEPKKWLKLMEIRFKSLSPSRLEGRSSFFILFINIL